MQQRIKNLLKHKSVYLAIFVTVVIAILSLIKIGKHPINFTYLDKIEHGIAYAVLTFFWLLAFGNNITSKIIVVLLCVFYGIIIEIIQGTTTYRTFDFADMFANSIGTVIGLLIFNRFIKNSNLFSN